MQFFHNNPKEDTYNPNQDKLYLTATMKMNLGYWMGSDIDFFYTNYKNDLNEFEFHRLKSQYNLAINIFNEGKDLLDQLEGPHLDAANLLSTFSFSELLEFGIDVPEKNYQNSELEEIEMLEDSSKFDTYLDNFYKFMSPNSIDFAFYKSNKEFMDALLAGFEILSNIDFVKDIDSQEKIQDVVDKITMARIYLQESPASVVKSLLRQEHEISVLGNDQKNSNHSFDDFYKSSNDYLDAWDAYYAHYEQFFMNLSLTNFIESEFDDNFSFLLHQEKSLYALINLKAIEISIMMLENLNQEIPHFEIYSARKVSSSIGYLIDQTSHETSRKEL